MFRMGMVDCDVFNGDSDIGRLVYYPFPVMVLPEPLRGFVRTAAKSIGCDSSYVALPLLTAVAAAIGNTRRLEVNDTWRVPPILWSVIVGESGTGKTPAFQCAVHFVRERQRKARGRYAEEVERYKVDLACWRKGMKAWRRDRGASGVLPKRPDPPRAERYMVSDTTVEVLVSILEDNPRGLLLARDELGGWLNSFDRYARRGKTSADLDSWLSMFSARRVVVNRKTGNRREIFVPQAAVCVVGGISPGILRRALDREYRESGLAARLLLTYPPRRAKRWTEDDIDSSAKAELTKLFDRLYGLQFTVGDDGEPRPGLVRLSDEAWGVWEAYFNKHAAELMQLIDDEAAIWSKLDEYAVRLALVIHYVRWAMGEVADELCLDGSSMRVGVVLANWFKREVRRVHILLGKFDG